MILANYVKGVARKMEELRTYFRQLKDSAHHIEDIVIPFADKITPMLPRNLEMRRDLNKIIALTCIVAFIHGVNRDHFRNEKPKQFIQDQWSVTDEYTYVLIATPEDFIEAMEIASDTIKRTINKASQSLMATNAALKELYNKNKIDEESSGILIKDVMQKTGQSESSVRSLLNQLCEKGFAWMDDAQRPFKYYPIDKKFSELDANNIIFSDEEYSQWVKKEQEKQGSAYVFVDVRSSQKQPINDHSRHENTKNAPQKADLGMRE